MQFLKKYFLWIVLVGIAAYAAYFFITLKGPCDTPIYYKVGTFDSRFNISQAQFLSDINQAAHIWDNVLNKNLFEYDATGTNRSDMPINLVYDSRQADYNANQGLQGAINTTEDSAASIKTQFTGLQDTYNTEKSQYDALVKEYNSNPDNMELENSVEEKRLQVNDLADQINALVTKYNSLVKNVNATISTVNQTAGEEFEEGEYLYDNQGQRINVYEFESQQNLTRLLAHELGHSLGLNHNSNPDSIMYYLNSSANMTPTAEDVAALKAACHIK